MTKYVLKNRKRWCALKSVFPDFERQFQMQCAESIESTESEGLAAPAICISGRYKPRLDSPAWCVTIDKRDIVPCELFNESSWNFYPATIPPHRGLMQLECWSFENQSEPLRCCGSYDESTDTWKDALTGDTIKAESIGFKPWG